MKGMKVYFAQFVSNTSYASVMYQKRLSREKELKNMVHEGKFLSAQQHTMPRIFPILSNLPVPFLLPFS